MRTLWNVFQHRPMARNDSHLLRAFVHDKSEEAFAELVQRHGGMVMGVCRRILGHSQDAEDAFQAAFLVLAQKAAGLHGDSPLGPWLYGVARRVALKARSRRPGYRTLVDAELLEMNEEASTMATSLDWSELRPVIDDEIARLPKVYQTVMILCQINGLTKLEAARHLGCPEGTISSRLMRAKAMLRASLARRGFTMVTLAMIDSLLTASPVSAQLAQSTVGIAMKIALGASLQTGVSSSILTLAQGAQQAMFITKFKMAALGLVLATGFTVGTGYVVGAWGQEKQANATQPVSAVKPDKVARKTETKSDPKSNAKLRDASSAPAELDKVDNQLTNFFAEEMTLDDRLNYLEERTGLVTLVDTSSFRDTFVDFDQRLLRNQKTTLPRMANQTTATMIHSLLENLQYENQSVPCTFMVRRGTLVIVPKVYVAGAASKIDAAFEARKEEVDLIQALEHLSLDTGVSIILDPRAKAQASDCKINTSFRNLKLINAVKLLANMADLSVINIDGSLFVSTPENCKRMEEEIAREAKGGQ